MTRPLLGAFVVLLLVGRSGLPVGVQLSDLVFPLLAWEVARGGLRLRRSDLWLGLWLFVTAVAALDHPSRTSAVEFAKMAYGPLILVVLREAFFRGFRSLAIRCLVIAAAVVAVLTILSIVGTYLGGTTQNPLLWRHPTRTGLILWRARGLFEVPEMLAELLTVATLLAMAWRSQAAGRLRIWLSVCVAVLLLASALTFSHALVGLSAGLLVMSWKGLPGWGRRLGAVAWSVLFLVIVALSSALPRPANSPSISPFNQHVITTSTVILWNQPWLIEWFHYGMLKGIAVEAFLGSPITGVGLGGFNEVSEAAYRAGSLTSTHAGADPHCELTGRLAETGLMGTLPTLLLWAFWIREGRSARDPYAQAAGVAVLAIIVNGIHVDFMNFRFLWLALAILENAPRTDLEEGPTAQPAI